MTGGWGEIRRRAREWHAKALTAAEGNPSAAALIAAASALMDVPCFGVPSSDPLLDGGDAALDTETGAIWFRNDIDPGLALYYQAHEFAHLWLDDRQGACDASDLAADAGASAPAVGVHRVEGYGPRERRERRANVFAGEFLLPAPFLRRWFKGGEDARVIARRMGLPEGLVLHHLARALLIPEGLGPTTQEETEARPNLDPSQKRAACAERGPLLVDAGPGTGKTRTLTARIEHLLASGCAATSILALTFSNRAAEEMRQRVARTAPAVAPDIWMGTFHAFGLELLRKYGQHVGLSPHFAVLDPTDALALLEGALPELKLDYYQNLYEPTIQLRDILSAISRAKDEHVGPQAYGELARGMDARATTDEEHVQAAKAMEVAHVYAVYEEHLRSRGAVDYGDLIGRSIDLLREHTHVARDVRARYEHVLVDEYQDINRASSLLLRELAHDGRGLWVVGDSRQAIYRFRGAAPANMALFARDLPGATTLALEINYRSQPAVVAAISELAPRMRTSRKHAAFSTWHCKREDARGAVRMEIATNLDAECVGIAAEIQHQHASGVRYRDQAVLCRSHTQLARVAARLETAGVPVFYLGNVFERPEVRDLLCVIALACEPSGAALHRVGRFPEYDVTPSDVQALLAFARNEKCRFPEALRLAAQAVGLSEEGRRKLTLVASHLDGIHFGTTPWSLLSEYLFVRSRYLASALDGGSLTGQQRGLAIYQLLQFAYEARRRKRLPTEDPKRAFLEHVRRLETLGDEKALREIPEDAAHLDAVRLLTVHASKGLEFRAVYLPYLGQGQFPARRRSPACPPPDGMLEHGIVDVHDEEEECLFFVGLSRARDTLCLSRAERYGEVKSNASSLLGLITPHLSRPASSAPTWTLAAVTAEQPAPPAPPAGERIVHRAEDLEVYIACPREYFYRHVLLLEGRTKSAYMRFHQSVFDVLHWLRHRGETDAPTDLSSALVRLSEVWQERGLDAHVHAAFYREQAERMVAQMLATVLSGGIAAPPRSQQVELQHGRIVFIPDHIGRLASGEEEVVRFRTGRVSKREGEKPVYALLRVGEGAGGPPSRRRVRIVSLSTGESIEATTGAAASTKALAAYDDAMRNIAAGHFPATADERRCPNCAYYFICPAP
ncbi:UvrD-helicase domain-containing protein [Sorangium sp. So ce124]|uniref:UvrD-helicase domain-containing protein n=1 Tax=Sorangium sp. So ce124 TaxID=3133280 RepID=UPI003F60922D